MPSFVNSEYAITYLADELTKANVRVSKLEGRIMALGSALAVSLATNSDAPTIQRVGEANIQSLSAIRGETDDVGSLATIDGFVEQMNQILVIEGAGQGQFPFTIIKGGKSG